MGEFRGTVAAHRAAVTRDSSEAVDRKLVCVAHCNTADTRHSHSLHHHDAMTSCLGSSLQMLMSIFLMFPPPPVPLHTSTTTTLSVATAPQHHSTTAQPHTVAWFPHSASFQIFPPHHPTLRWRMISTAQTRVTHQLQLFYWIYPISRRRWRSQSLLLVRGVTSPRSGATDSSMTVGADTGGTAQRSGQTPPPAVVWF